MKHIILIGFMGCGKTCVGKALARNLKIGFIDMDEQIVEKAGMPITEIFIKYGEQHFRELETEVLKELLANEEQTVISSGGGMPMQEANQLLLKESTVVYIEASVDVLMTRLKNDKDRPIIQGGDLREKIVTLLIARSPIYEQVSDIKVVTSNGPINKIVGQIVEKLVEKRVQII